MDADDVALPALARAARRAASRRRRRCAVVGTGMIDLDGDGRLGHGAPHARRRRARCAGRRSSPRRSSTRPSLLDRAVLERHGLRYDTSFGESEDYDLWARLLDVADGDNVREALVLYRKHADAGVGAAGRAAARLPAARRAAADRRARPAARRRRSPSSRGAPAPGSPLAGRDCGGSGRALLTSSSRRSRRATAATRRAGRPPGPSPRAWLRRETVALVRAALGSTRRCPVRGLAAAEATGDARAERAAAATWLRAAPGRAGRRHVGLPGADAVSDGDARPAARRGPSSS